MSSQHSVYYLSSTAVLLAEIFKFCVCVFVGCWQESTRTYLHYVFCDWDNWRKAQPLLISSFLYTCGNNLSYLSLSNISGSDFQLLSQGKTLSTAIFSVALLRTQLSRIQWLSLILLVTGMAVAQSCKSQSIHSVVGANPFVGYTAIVGVILLSGFAGVYQEQFLKGSLEISINSVNMHLSVFSILIGSIIVLHDMIQTNASFFQGYTPLVWFVVFMASSGGILFSLVLKYTSGIAKNYVTSLSVLGVPLVTSIIRNTRSPLSCMEWCISACIVLISIFVFMDPQAKIHNELCLNAFNPTISSSINDPEK